MRLEEGFTELPFYTQYNRYTDDNIVVIDNERNIPEITQKVLKGDIRSQYITFEVQRYWDGEDITDKLITVRWFNEENVADGGIITDICDARYNDDVVRFAWLLDSAVASVAGTVGFLFMVSGENEVEDSYILKTELGKLTVGDSMDNDANGEMPEDSWFVELLAKVNQMYTAAAAAEEAAARVDAVIEEANEAIDTATETAERLESAAESINNALGQVTGATENANTSAESADAAAARANSAAENAEQYSSAVVDVARTETGLKITWTNGTTEEFEVAGSGGLSFDGGYQDEEGYIHLTKDGEDIEGFDPFLVAGGGGGGGSGSRLTFACYTATSTSVLESSGTAPIEFKFQSIDVETQMETGPGTLTVTVNGTQRMNISVNQGDHQTVDTFPYLTKGSNAVVLVMTDSYGTTATRKFTQTLESFDLTWDLAECVKNTEAALSFYITPTGSGVKKIYTYVDDGLHSTDTISTSGRRLTKTITGLSHGSHKIEVYGELTLDGMVLESNHLIAAVAQVIVGNSTPVIAVNWPEGPLTQYTTQAIAHMVVDPENNPTSVSYLVNDVVYATESIDQSAHIWSYRPVAEGSFKLGIMVGTTIVEKTYTVGSIGADVEEILNGLDVKVEPSTITSLADWEYGDYSFTLSDGFDEVNGGLQTDEEGIHCIRIMAGDRLTLNYPIFGGDIRRTGREVKIIYTVKNSSLKETEAINCLSGGIGLSVCANNVYLSGNQTTITLSTCEDEKTELDINIQPDSGDRLMQMWEMCSTFSCDRYSASENFTHATPQNVVFGSDDADVYLYLFRAYSRDLTDDEVKANFIADGKDGAEILSRKSKNDIYDSSGTVNLTAAQQKNPDCHFFTLDAERMSIAKSDAVSCTIHHVYVSGGEGHQWVSSFAIIKVQGTSSVEHATLAGPNLNFELNNGFDMEDGSHEDGYAMHGESQSIPVNLFTYKKNIASQDHIINSCVSEWYNRFQPSVRPARVTDPRVRDAMESAMCAVFFHNIGSNAVDVGPDTIQPDETAFFGLGNICSNKDCYDTFQYHDIVIEVKNNTEPQVLFKTDDLTGDNFDNNYEFRYLNEGTYTEEQAKEKWQEVQTFVHSCDWTEPTNTALSKAENFNGQAFTTDSAAYRKAKWRAEAANYFDMDTLYFHHNITLFFLLRDNRAKNMFWSMDENGKWGLWFAWDHDTGLCRNNEGYVDIEPGYMDFDTIGSSYVFNGATNVIFSNIRECNFDELRQNYIDLENKGCWDIDDFYDLCMQRQEQICESLWIEDYERNDIRTLQNLGTDAYLKRGTGRLRLHIKKALKFQKALVDSYFLANACVADSASFRGYTPSEWSGVQPSGLVEVTMYTDMYVNVLAGSTAYQQRVEAGVPVTIDLSAAMNDTEIYWRNAEWYQAFGDLSALYLGQFEASKLKRVRKLPIGSDVEGYYNSNFTQASFDNCVKLEEVNMGGLVNAARAFDFSKNLYLKKFYSKGSGITGLRFAKNGRLQEAHLNAIASLYLSGLYQLETLDVESYEQLTSLTVENCPNLDTYTMVKNAENLSLIRLLDIDWSVPTAAYDVLHRLHYIQGIDDDGYNTQEGVITGEVYFVSISDTKYNAIVALIPTVTFTYGEKLEEYTVTFKNDDGTTLNVQTVERGGAAKDPITAGYITTPTKDPTTEKVYTFYKWDLPFDYIVADTVITATYSEATRYNTVKFVDSDGSVLETYQVPAHGSCSYQGEDLERAGYVWIGWDKETDDVIEDMTVTAVYIYPTLPSQIKDISDYDYAYSDDSSDNAAYTFSEFYAIVKTGQVLTYFPVTTKIKMKLRSSAIADTDIVLNLHAKGHYELCSGGMSNADFYMVGVLNANRQMNTTNTNAGGWDQCRMRTWLNETLFPTLDPKWRNFIAKSKTLASDGGTLSSITTSEDYLRLPSTAELGFNTADVPYKDEVSPDAGEIAFSQYTDNNSRIKKTYNGEGTATNYWTRSAEASGSASFRNISTNGHYISYYASAYYGVCLGFSA